MRVLGWMHHRAQKTNVEPFKDFLIGNCCTCLSAQSPIDDHASYSRPSFDSRYGSRLLKQPNKECENTFSESEGVDDNNSDGISTINSDLFRGFLTIGTLGSESNTSEPATPTFPMSLENITEGKIEVTENDLKLVNNELEKFLEAEAEESCNESLGRSSYVSTITLSGMQMEATDAEDYEKMVACPLQGYLFGSSIELPETRNGVKKEKVSLGEMFRATKVTDEIPSENEVKEEMQAKKAHKSAKYLIKKILTKFRSTSGNPNASNGNEASNSVSTKKKLNKVLKMFHRKVHPENPQAEKEFMKIHRDKTMNTQNDGGYNVDLMHQIKDNRKFLPGSKSMEGVQCHKNNSKLPQYSHICSNSSSNGEYWIKTDADYLVLEL